MAFASAEAGSDEPMKYIDCCWQPAERVEHYRGAEGILYEEKMRQRESQRTVNVYCFLFHKCNHTVTIFTLSLITLLYFFILAGSGTH